MLESTIQALASGRTILASGSPRRHAIMKQLVNNRTSNLFFLKATCIHAYGEPEQSRDDRSTDPVPPSLIIGADTMVTMGDVIYGKPQNEAEAFRMLSSLANKQHVVYTGVCLKTPKAELQFHESARVKFGDGIGGCLIERIEGDYYTITGLPLYSLAKQLNRMFANV
ncbi:N-acetylserotonin O-methyltransferase-like protein [Temnothorax longispinosus]|uniref:N-acetylserotonin O-methyltransferase-like protein n=1 Tax=Temnothorax longispinosus TaxID=300112 RepID=A0A4S2KJ29_9HYME|nr:N-acetylserotonin O-methyltransferase-like protein [Temnothorax longispinosus]